MEKCPGPIDGLCRETNLPTTEQNCKNCQTIPGAYDQVKRSGESKRRREAGLEEPVEVVEKKFDLDIDCGVVGIAIPSRNERHNTAATVFDIKANTESELRFCVIDDGSTDGGPTNLPSGTTLIKHGKSKGQGCSRNEGSRILFSNGCDVVIILDSHMRTATPDAMCELARTSIVTGGIVCATTHNIDYDHDFVGNGGRLEWATERSEGVTPGLRMFWSYKRDCVIQPIQSVYGASYAMTKEVFEKVGGWRDTVSFGYGEQALAIAAFFLDIPMYCNTKVHMRHLFRYDRPYNDTNGYWANFVRCNRMLFNREVFDHYFWPVASRWANDASLINIVNDKTVDRKQREFEDTKCHSDKECLEWMGVL